MSDVHRPRLERLDPTAVERPWGGHGVPSLGLLVPEALRGRPVGEYWLPATEFPLLVKIIDARERLSVQVHPDDEVARSMNLRSGKTEAWFVLDAKPGAELWLGLEDGVAADDFLAAAKRGEDVSTRLVRHEPRVGETYFVPAGAIHAVGAGLTILEIQQPTDVTYRLYDWNRTPERPLHLDAAARSIHARAKVQKLAADDGPTRDRTPLVDCAHFAMERVVMSSPTLDLASEPVPVLWYCRAGIGSCIAGDARIDFAPGVFFLARPGPGSLQMMTADRHAIRPFVDLIRIMAR